MKKHPLGLDSSLENNSNRSKASLDNYIGDIAKISTKLSQGDPSLSEFGSNPSEEKSHCSVTQPKVDAPSFSVIKSLLDVEQKSGSVNGPTKASSTRVAKVGKSEVDTADTASSADLNAEGSGYHGDLDIPGTCIGFISPIIPCPLEASFVLAPFFGNFVIKNLPYDLALFFGFCLLVYSCFLYLYIIFIMIMKKHL